MSIFTKDGKRIELIAAKFQDKRIVVRARTGNDALYDGNWFDASELIAHGAWEEIERRCKDLMK